MTDASAPVKKSRLNYKQPDFFIRTVDLEFDLHDGETFVTATMQVERNQAHDRPLVLNGKNLETQSILLNGEALAPQFGYEITKLDDEEGDILSLPTAENSFQLKTRVRIEPEKNEALAGLYKSDGMWCTQCEAIDFRNITWFVDRPDNMASYKVKITADKAVAPVLLSNGNLIDKGDLPDGRHYTVWDDPAPKPSYLFALVGADLAHIEEKFVTMNGREVTLRVYAEPKDTDKLAFAMQAVVNSLRWDEKNYGREYDLDLFNVVAVDYFNMGAMENRSLNIFNTKYVLANPRTQTDSEFFDVEAVVAHEFFHHWTGNNVTVRDWTELTLKEGLTVFRDQSFSSDMGSAATTRIDVVKALRSSQFKQDAGPMAHAIRADEYESINNFYTSTVYDKGAEVIRMIKTLIGPDAYRAATDLYFERHTGQAVTCDDFVQAMQDASGYDMTQFKLWYSQAGTPTVDAAWAHDTATGQFTLKLKQTVPPTPGQPTKEPMVIPVSFGMVGPDGKDVALDGNGNTNTVLELSQAEQVFVFDNIPAGSVPSLFRNFSAPIILNAPYTNDNLRHLMVNDSNGFNQWDAGNQFILKEMLVQVDNAEAGKAVTVDPAIIDAMRDMIRRPDMDKQLLALMLDIPGYSELSLKRGTINPDALLAVEDAFSTAIRTELHKELVELYESNNIQVPYTYDVQSVGRRSLKNIALYYLSPDEAAKSPETIARAAAQYQNANNMTDRSSGLRSLLRMDRNSDEAKAAMADYYQSFKSDSSPLDTWFGMNVSFAGKDAIQSANEMVTHPDYANASPNRIRSVIGGVALTPKAFHNIDGSGYAYIAEQTCELDKKNPQTAARFVDFLADFRKYQDPWKSKMQEALIHTAQNAVSTDVRDKLKKILGDDYPAVPVVAAPAP